MMKAQRISPRRAAPRQGAWMKYAGPLSGLLLVVVFFLVFFAGRGEDQPLNHVAPRVGLSYESLMEMGPRIAATTGATLGTSRRVVYLLACSGMADSTSFETQATEASRLAREQRLSDREAVLVVLAQRKPPPAGEASLKSC